MLSVGKAGITMEDVYTCKCRCYVANALWLLSRSNGEEVVRESGGGGEGSSSKEEMIAQEKSAMCPISLLHCIYCRLGFILE